MDGKSIQDIIPPARSKPIRQPLQTSPSMPPPPTPPQPMNLKPEKSGFASFVFIVAGVLVLAGIGIGVLSTVFHRAYVSVTPYAFSASIDQTIQATQESGATPYQKVSVTEVATKSVPATGTQHVENRSTGTITVYNAYSTTAQRLITNTRFTSASGLVYRIHAPITVPGYTMKAGVKVPGSIEATVYADEAGEKYNADLTQFTVPGLKGTTQYTLITARSKTAMAGGFIGQQAVVDATVRLQTVDALKAQLGTALRTKIASATTAGSIIFDGSIVITYTENTDAVDGGNAVISVSGQATAPAFVENDLAHQFALVAGISYDGPLSIQNPKTVTVQVDPASNLDTGPISVTIAGTPILVSTFDQETLAKDLSGKSKKEIQTVLPSYSGISAIDVKIYPFWLGGIPADPAKVKVTVVDSAQAPKP